MKKVNNKSNKEKNEEKNKKIILIIIAIIIIILALITSCSCTSKFWGRIGELFRNEGTYVFKEQEGNFCETNGQCETIINKDLQFDKDVLDISVSDENVKLTYTFKNINPKEFTCVTSDANIATCYVNKDGYVVINPKSEGKVTVTLQTEENDKIYQATATINIGKPTKGIILSNDSGTINLRTTKTKTITYRLAGISGNITVSSSDESIATATVKDGILRMTAYKTGKVTITLTVEDNGKTYTTTYTLTVVNNANGGTGSGTSGKPGTNPSKPGSSDKPGSTKDSNNKLSNLTTNKGSLTPAFKEDIKNYKIYVNSSDNDITLKATPSSNKATVTYTFNGKTNTSGKIEGLTPGNNVVTITIKAEDGSTNIYTVTIVKPGTPETPKDKDSSLMSLTTNKGDVSPVFNPGTHNYTKDIAATDTSITITAKPNSPKATVTYTFNGITNATGVIDGLEPGPNKVIVTVTAEDGSTTEYTITVNRPHVYEVKFEENSYNCYLEDGTCLIKYSVFKDGEEIFDYNPSDIAINLPDYKGTATVGTGEKLGFIELKPDTKEMLNKTVDLTITYNGVSAVTKVNFKSENYYLQSLKNEYDMSIDSENNTRPVMFQTNLFDYVGNDPEDLIVNRSADGKSITITSRKDPNINLQFTTSGDITISYDPKAGTSYLPIIVTAHGAGEAHIYAQGTAFGKKVPEQALDIKLNITQKFIVKLQSGEGMFNELSKEYEYKISTSEKIDLTKLDEPIKIVPNDDCKYYKFKGYIKKGDPTETLIYYKNADGTWNNSIITGITEDTTFVAVYDETQEFERTFESKTMWLVDVPLFHNEEYYNKYGEDKVIYPGAKGKYTMIFKNESPDDITLTGMILEEDTICVDVDKDGKNDGCINMSYIIKDEYNNYLYGSHTDNKDNYIILHRDVLKLNTPVLPYTYRKDWNFDEDTKPTMTLEANSSATKELKITIHWEWTFYVDDFNDKIDTAIGNQAAASATDETLNDMYKLKVGIKYDKTNTKCVSSSSGE